MDITVRVGYPFKQTVHYTVGESAKSRGFFEYQAVVAKVPTPDKYPSKG